MRIFGKPPNHWFKVQAQVNISTAVAADTEAEARTQFELIIREGMYGIVSIHSEFRPCDLAESAVMRETEQQYRIMVAK